MKLFQINESDLQDLEHTLPTLFERLSLLQPSTNADKVAARRVQRILSSVRWNYGPYSEVTVIPAEEKGNEDVLPG